MKDGDHIVVQGISGQAPGLYPGDLFVIIREKKHNSYHQQHADLLMNQKMSQTQSFF
jgi:DnaJ-class molecular chaperone